MPAALSNAARDAMAARLVQSYLDGRHLPPFLPGEPPGMAAALAASRVAPALLDALASLYGVQAWSPASYERAVLRGAFSAWNAGTEVVRSRGVLRVVSTQCPIAEQVARDPRVCTMCRAVQSELAQRALGPDARVVFEKVLTRGDAVCDARVREKKPVEALT